MNFKLKPLTLTLTLGLLAFFLVQCNDIEPAPIVGNTTFTSANDFLKSKAPQAQSFTEDASTYISITSSNGFQYQFAQGSLLLNGSPVTTGNVDFEITEYVSKADMIFSGVTTTAGDNPLVSGGMFNIEATQGGQQLSLNGNYQMSIPAKSIDLNMLVFQGEEILNPDNSEGVNWVQQDSSWVSGDTVNNQDSGRYYLNLNFLSWCNLDKYYNATTGGQVRLKLPTECTSSNTTVYMIFDENSVVNLFADATLEEFNSGNYILPLGWDINLLAVCVDEDKNLKYSLTSSTITDPHLETVTTMTTISEADLEALIESL